MNIFMQVIFFTTKRGGSKGPTVLESDGPYFLNHGTMTWAHHKSEGLIQLSQDGPLYILRGHRYYFFLLNCVSFCEVCFCLSELSSCQSNICHS